MNTREILVAARELISVPERWTQGSLAESRLGRPIGPSTPGAVCWCALGAVQKVADDLNMPFGGAVSHLNKAGPINLGLFNDTHTHPEVVALFDRAIASCEGGENG